MSFGCQSCCLITSLQGHAEPLNWTDQQGPAQGDGKPCGKLGDDWLALVDVQLLPVSEQAAGRRRHVRGAGWGSIRQWEGGSTVYKDCRLHHRLHSTSTSSVLSSFEQRLLSPTIILNPSKTQQSCLAGVSPLHLRLVPPFK